MIVVSVLIDFEKFNILRPPEAAKVDTYYPQGRLGSGKCSVSLQFFLVRNSVRVCMAEIGISVPDTKCMLLCGEGWLGGGEGGGGSEEGYIKSLCRRNAVRLFSFERQGSFVIQPRPHSIRCQKRMQ